MAGVSKLCGSEIRLYVTLSYFPTKGAPSMPEKEEFQGHGVVAR